jgi:hypothetical protein
MLVSRSSDTRRRAMTLCPVAIAVGCKKCPVFAVCPLKTVIGDYDPSAPPKKPSARTKPPAKKHK